MSQQPIFGITNIPEDILLELSGNVLKLKSGSVCTKTDGTQFQTIGGDATYSGTTFSTDKYFVFRSASASSISFFNAAHVISGTTAPASGTGYVAWYDTTNNLIKAYNNGTDTGTRLTLPLGIVSYTHGTGVTAIDRIFNGFGYMGSLYYILPDVEGFYPNGKDGFNNLFQTVRHTTLSIHNCTGWTRNLITCFNTNLTNLWKDFVIVDEKPEPQNMITWYRYYNKEDNFVYTYTGSSVLKDTSVPYGYITTASSSPYNITSFEIVNPFAMSEVYDYLYASNKPLSQYANSQKFMDLYNNLCGMFSNAKTMKEWYNVVFNLKTASGYGLDIWGKILNQGRQFSYEDNGVTQYVFLGGEQTIDGITYSAEYMEEMYRMVLFLKALTYITNCTLASLNGLLQYYFKDRIDPETNQNVYVINYGTMEIRYVFQFYVSKIEKSIFTSGVMPRPTGVLANFEFIPYGGYFGFFVSGEVTQPYAPFDNKPFYR